MQYRVGREGLLTPYFTNLRDCKLSWKFLNTATWTVDNKTFHTFKEIKDVKEKSADDKDCDN